MAGFAQGSRSGLSYGVQSDFDTEFAGTPISLPINTHTLDLQKQRLQGNEIQPDRMPRVDRHGNRAPGGDINVDFRADAFDDLIECVMLDTFATSGADTLTVGTTPQYLTIEDRLEDITQYRKFTGMTCNAMSMNIRPNAMIETVFSMIGKDMTISGTSVGTPSAAPGTEPMDSFSGSISEGGSTISRVSSLQFSITNNFTSTFVVGSQVAPCLNVGRATVEGTLTTYVENATEFNKFLNETETSIEVVLDDTTSGRTYTFLIPRVKYNTGNLPLQGEQERLLTLQFVGLYDSSETTNLKLTRSL